MSTDQEQHMSDVEKDGDWGIPEMLQAAVDFHVCQPSVQHTGNTPAPDVLVAHWAAVHVGHHAKGTDKLSTLDLENIESIIKGVKD